MPRYCTRCDSPLYVTERYLCCNCTIEAAAPTQQDCSNCGSAMDDEGAKLSCSTCGYTTDVVE